jgi:hypothetical protein
MTKIANETIKCLYSKKGQPKKDVPSSRTPPLPLVPETISKDELVDLRKKGSYDALKVNPALENSAEYKFSMYHVDGTESLRTTIQWYKDVWQVIQKDWDWTATQREWSLLSKLRVMAQPVPRSGHLGRLPRGTSHAQRGTGGWAVGPSTR